jgi:hypothetical protein
LAWFVQAVQRFSGEIFIFRMKVREENKGIAMLLSVQLIMD